MTDILRRTWAEIDLDAVRQNYETVRRQLSPGCRCMAVVKADSYGHGAVPVATTLAAAGVDWFGVSSLEEALQLRDHGIANPILIFSYTPPSEAAQLAKHNITQAVISRDYAERLEAAAAEADVTVNVHIKLDTGMSRVGFLCQDIRTAPLDAIAESCAMPHLNAEGIFTHFATADDSKCDTITHRQFSLFTDVLERLKDRGIAFAIRHCCNSAAALRFPEMHLDMVRAGIVLYGAAPSAELKDRTPRHPAMVLKTVVSQIKHVPTGTYISYGHTYRTDRPTVLATLPIGYADGLLRAASGSFNVSVNGQLAPLVGRVCMDQCMIDVTDIPNVSEGMTVTVFGADGVSVEDYAAGCDTIPYESLCLVSKRVSRLFYEHGELVKTYHSFSL